MNRSLPLVAFLLLPVALAWARPDDPEPLAPERALASLVPARCLVYAESTTLAGWCEEGLEHPLVARLLASAPGQALLARLPLTPAEALAQADAWLGAPLLDELARVSTQGLAFALDPRTQESLVIARGRSADEVEAALEHALDALERQFGWPGALDRPQHRWSGADVWILGEGAVARRDELLVLASRAELARAALELAAEAEGRGLLAGAEFAAAHAARDREALVWSWLALEELEPLADAGFRELRSAGRTPAMQGVFGARLAALAEAPFLAASARLDGQGLALDLHGVGGAPVAALTPGARPADVPATLATPCGAEALLYRDYARFFTERSALFPPEALPAFAEAITNGALFFEGQDLGEEVLPHLSPWLRVLVREPEFASGLRPEIPLPAAALVAVLDAPEAGAEWQAAFQTIVSIANVDQAQKGQRGMRLALEREGEVDLSIARFSAPRPGEGVDLRYNLEPTLAVAGRHLVLASHASLARALVRELAGRAPDGEGREFLRLSAGALGSVLRENLATLVAKKQVEEGLERAQAEAELRLLLEALALFDGLELALDPARSALRLELALTPEAAR